MTLEDREQPSFLQKLKKQPIFREKILHTVWIFWAFIMLGWAESLFGPTFPDLRLIIGETLDTASWLLTITAAGCLAGSALTGFLYDKYDKLLLLIGSIIGTAVTIAAVPWCPYFWLMMIVKFFTGVLAASLDTGGNADIVYIWDTKVGPYMQALHFCFSVGGMIAPFVAEPFLAKARLENVGLNESVTKSENNTVKTLDVFSVRLNNTDLTRKENGYIISNEKMLENNTDDFLEGYGNTTVQYPYIITAVLVFITVIPFSVMYYTQPSEQTKTERAIEQKESTSFNTLPLQKKILILCNLSLLIIIYCGTDDTYAGFLMTFAITQLKWSKSDGSFATSLHWICFGLARLGCIFLVRFVETSKLIVIFGALMVISFTGLLISTIYDIQPLIWIFIGCPGISMSLIFPAMFTWTNENVVNVSGKISAMFLMSASTGVMLFPLLFGYTMERFSPIWFLYLLLGQSVIWVLLFSATLMLTKCMLKRNASNLEIRVDEEEPLNMKTIEKMNAGDWTVELNG